MWNKPEVRYHIQNVDVSLPLEELTVPQGCSGMAFVVRLNRCPVGFFMEALSAGSRLEPAALADRIIRRAGKQILSERIYQELRSCSGRRHAPS